MSTFFKLYISRQSYGRSSICEALHNCFWSYNIYDMIHWGSYHIPEERVEYDGNYGDTEAGVPKDNVLKEFFIGVKSILRETSTRKGCEQNDNDNNPTL